MIKTLQDSKEVRFLSGKADFLLCASVTKTCNIKGITQAGIPGKIELTPTLDAEFLSTGRVFSLEDLAETASGIPTPALLTKAVSNLVGFNDIKILDLGMSVKPKLDNLVDFGIESSVDISSDECFDAKSVFEKGVAYAKRYKSDCDYIIVAESTPSGTTTAAASAKVLGYDSTLFASSFKDSPLKIKDEVIQKAIKKIKPNMGIFEKLGCVSDNTLMFVAGFVLEISKRYKVVLGGGTQMASALLIASKIASLRQLHHDHRNIHLATTAWIAKDGSSDINKLLSNLDFNVKAFYADFSYSDAKIPVLKLYDEGEAKEGVGAGSALCVAFEAGVSQSQITAEVERMMMEIGD